MTGAELIALLESSGFKTYREIDSSSSRGGSECFRCQRVLRRQNEGRYVCRLNHKLMLDITMWSSGGRILDDAVSVELCAERPDGRWSTLKLYGLKNEDVAANHDAFGRQLLAAWDKLCEVYDG